MCSFRSTLPRKLQASGLEFFSYIRLRRAKFASQAKLAMPAKLPAGSWGEYNLASDQTAMQQPSVQKPMAVLVLALKKNIRRMPHPPLFLVDDTGFSSIGGSRSRLRTYSSNSLLRYSFEANASESSMPGIKFSQAPACGSFRLAPKKVQCPQ